MPHPPRIPHRSRARLLPLLAAASLAAGLLAVPAGGAGAPASAAASSGAAVPAIPTVDPAGQTYLVTLVTGDVVGVSMLPDGRQSAWVESSAATVQPRIYEQDGHVHVVPAAAEPFLRSDRVDERLFDVTYLVQEGYHDGVTAELPLLITPDDDGDAALLAAPAGTRAVRELASIDAVAVTAPKAEVGTVWAQLEAGTIGQVW
ncbi:hypothetical protein E1269_31165, partial [Jiangella asiatica]